MSKQRKSNPEKLRLDADFLAKQMQAVSTMMWTVAEQMEDFNGFNPRLKERGLKLASLGVLLDMWADEVRAQAKKI
jgi:hypothetical protein